MLKVGLGFSFASGCLGHLPRIGLPAIDVNDNSRLGLRCTSLSKHDANAKKTPPTNTLNRLPEGL